MAKIYTKTGDEGRSSLLSGERVTKSHPRLELYGQLDELNSFIGLLKSSLDQDKFLNEISFLKEIQIALFNLGALLSCDSDKWEKFRLPLFQENMVDNIESKIDKMEEELDPIKNFVLPGPGRSNSYAHLCRVLARKAERTLVGFGIDHPSEIPPRSLKVLNRLSDYFFVLSRFINKKEGLKEELWM